MSGWAATRAGTGTDGHWHWHPLTLAPALTLGKKGHRAALTGAPVRAPPPMCFLRPRPRLHTHTLTLTHTRLQAFPLLKVPFCPPPPQTELTPFSRPKVKARSLARSVLLRAALLGSALLCSALFCCCSPLCCPALPYPALPPSLPKPFRLRSIAPNIPPSPGLLSSSSHTHPPPPPFAYHRENPGLNRRRYHALRALCSARRIATRLLASPLALGCPPSPDRQREHRRSLLPPLQPPPRCP